MKKILVQGFILVVLFFSTWFGLSKADWIKILRIEKVSSQTEEKLGEALWTFFKQDAEENRDLFIKQTIDSIVSKICTANGINRSKLKIHILNKGDINAFALPDGHLVLLTGLMANCESPEALAGVIAHEIAHIESGHIMKKLVKELGLSMMISIATGSGSPEVVINAAKLLSSSAFDRKMEREADINGAEYLLKANIDARPFADFMYQLAEPGKISKLMSWISTHPESAERAEYIIHYLSERTVEADEVIAPQTWNRLQERLEK